MMGTPTPTEVLFAGSSSRNSLSDEREDSPTSSETPYGLSPVSASPSSNPLAPSGICDYCQVTCTDFKTLPCLHTFCLSCLHPSQNEDNKVLCPRCFENSHLTSESAASLLPKFLMDNDSKNLDQTKMFCTSCKNNASFAIGCCCDCNSYLCFNCMVAHQYMHCFDGHRIMKLPTVNGEDMDEIPPSFPGQAHLCPLHKNEPLAFFCKTCSVHICLECKINEHPLPLHDIESLNEACHKFADLLGTALSDHRTKAAEIMLLLQGRDNYSISKVHYTKAQNEINDTFQFYKSMLEERKHELLRELEVAYSRKRVSLELYIRKENDNLNKILNACDLSEKLFKQASVSDSLMLKKLIDSKLQDLTVSSVQANIQSISDLEFVSNYQAIQVGIKNTFGYIRSNPEMNVSTQGKLPPNPIARPVNGLSASKGINGTSGSLLLNGIPSAYALGISTDSKLNSPTDDSDSNLISSRFSSNALGPFPNSMKLYEKWSSGDNLSLTLTKSEDAVSDLSSKLLSTSLNPLKTPLCRQKMTYYCKFGEYGVLEGQFTEPSGVAVNAQNDIIVADTNNHRIQIFDKEGRFKFQFGEGGKRDGQFLYPNRVAVVKTSGDIIITERSPTHQVQIYNQYGQFVRKFGANILQYPRGVAIDNKGRIIIVECKVMRVIIFDQNGNVLKKFGCSKYVEFPNGVVVNDKEEIFISDNRAHCVKVFNYEGAFLRQIGGYGIINYPIGVAISASGEILIADNHNNFNLTIFTQEGQFISALESKIKHAQCFDVALMDDGSVVLASKDYRLYVYRYVPIPPIGPK